eukprot:9502747-Pyramimonas_sp.AAC.1
MRRGRVHRVIHLRHVPNSRVPPPYVQEYLRLPHERYEYKHKRHNETHKTYEYIEYHTSLGKKLRGAAATLTKRTRPPPTSIVC